MILIELVSDEVLKLFEDVPNFHHQTMAKLYDDAIHQSKNKPEFIKINCLELIKFKFIRNEFQEFDVSKELNEFVEYYYNLEYEQKNVVKLGFKEDMEEILIEYLNCK